MAITETAANRTMDPALMTGGTPRVNSMRAALGGLGLVLGLLAMPAGPATAADDYASDDTTQASVDLSGTDTEEDSATGELEKVGDADWFAVKGLEDGKRYRFHMKGAHDEDETFGTLVDSYLRLLDSGSSDSDNKTILDKDDDSGLYNDALITFKAQSSDTLYLEADNPDDYYTGTYTIYAEELKEDDCNPDNTGTNCEVTTDLQSKDIEIIDDVDWFEASLSSQTSSSYAFDISSGFTDPYLELRDANGNLHLSHQGSGSARLTFTSISGNNVFATASSGSDQTGGYDIRYFSYPDDCPSNPLDPTAPTYSGTVWDCSIKAPDASGDKNSGSGDVQKSKDTDWFKVTNLVAEGSYKFNLTGDEPLNDPQLRILDPSGKEVAFDDDGNNPHAEIGFTPPKDGYSTYYAASEPSQGGDTGTYTLYVKNYSDTDCPGSPHTDSDCTIGVGDTLNSTDNAKFEILASGDADWFEVTGLSAGESYRLELRPDGLTDPFLRIYDGNGKELRAYGDDKNFNDTPAQVAFTLPDDATFPYFVSAESGTEGDTGTYELNAKAVSDDYADCIGSSCSPGRLSVGDTKSGDLEFPGDRDWFAVDLEEGGEYTLRLKNDTLKNPYLRLFNDAGDEVFRDDSRVINYTDTEIVFAPSSDGTFYMEAGSSQDDPGAYSVEAILNSDSSGGVTSDGSSGGGCTLAGTRGPLDPTLPLLLGLSLAYLLSRGRARAH